MATQCSGVTRSSSGVPCKYVMATELPPHHLPHGQICIFLFGTEYERSMSGAVPEVIVYRFKTPKDLRTDPSFYFKTPKDLRRDPSILVLKLRRTSLQILGFWF